MSKLSYLFQEDRKDQTETASKLLTYETPKPTNTLRPKICNSTNMKVTDKANKSRKKRSKNIKHRKERKHENNYPRPRFCHVKICSSVKGHGILITKIQC